ncbi:sensor histidine kinase [Brevibacterium marinum]|uniref:histidine kinase n=1 Tax=Brevibacterium marinum TaxID=418643 RepID=A0A846S4H5_9MICO|nr:histidine kinase [Brevibacterium marinum]NJC55757.1 signal transduction histidine kinase [Brevibacterium marinum]
MAENSTSQTPTRTDVYLVLALAAASIVFAVLYNTTSYWPFKGPLWLICLMSVLVTLPLIWRRRYPSQTAWIQAAVFVTAQALEIMEPGVTQIIVFMGVYAVGAWQRNRRAAFISRLLLCVGIFVYLFVSMILQFESFTDMTVLQFAAGSAVTFLVNVAFFGGAWLFGNRAWSQRRILNELRSANAEIRSQEQQLTNQALDLERVRIARELHDGIAHHITGVGIHAAAARRSLEKNPDKARESLKTIESSTRETVDELRALVYTLRDTDDASIGEHNAQGNPGLGDVPELVDASRRSGQRITVHTIGQSRPLTPITEMSLYRVIQESLTNCRRYAGLHAEVQVRLRYGSTELEVEISDSRSPGALRDEPRPHLEPAPEHDLAPAPERSHEPAPEPAPERDPESDDDDSAGTRVARHAGSGLGIIGMRERMSALGGTLEAGPKSRGGWLVRARIPYPRNVAEPEAEAPSPAASETAASSTGPDAPASSAADSTAKA